MVCGSHLGVGDEENRGCPSTQPSRHQMSQMSWSVSGDWGENSSVKPASRKKEPPHRYLIAIVEPEPLYGICRLRAGTTDS